MTDSNYTHIAFLVDRSGSMSTIRKDMEGGFDSFVAEQRKQPGRCTFTLAQFDTEYELLHRGVDIDDVRPLALIPRGSTALLDSIGRLIHDTGAFLADLDEDQRPGVVIFGVLTDGEENSSREYSHQAVRELIEQQERDYSWVFTYLGANQDAIKVGGGLGFAVGQTMTFDASSAGVANSMSAYASNTSALRSAVAGGAAVAQAAAAATYTDEQRRAAVDR